MKFIKRSTRNNPQVSLILLDWSVRESFHLLHYLSQQNVDRNDFEVVIIEYYSRVSEAIKNFEEQVDTWIVLEMPEACYYHKHLMYNIGIAFSQGEIAVICDSDAMVKDNFIKTIIDAFATHERIILHLDQFRNMRRDFYPFNYPSFEDVLGEGCINNVNGKTKGIVDIEDPLHARNYGACMCAKREDLIAIGGADEHIDFLGHICGPYDLTFRLVNKGYREIWHESEFMYHTWHPGQAGVDNYLGPHDGKHMSTTSLEALVSKRVMPYVENAAIQRLRKGEIMSDEVLEQSLINPDGFEHWQQEKVEKISAIPESQRSDTLYKIYKGFKINRDAESYKASLLIDAKSHLQFNRIRPNKISLKSDCIEKIQQDINQLIPPQIQLTKFLANTYFLGIRIIKKLAQLVKIPNKPVKPVTSRMGDFLSAKNHWSDSMMDLLVNLHFFRGDILVNSEKSEFILLVDSKLSTYFLELMKGINILPSIKIIHLEDSNQLTEFLKNLQQENKTLNLILGKTLYCKYYTCIIPYELTINTLIV